MAAAHTEIIDQVVEIDEQLMALYLEQGEELTPEQLHDPFEQALREGHLVPVCFVSAETGAGVKELLEVFARLMPNPLEGNPPPFLKGEGAAGRARRRSTPDPERHVIAHVFKVSIDPFVGRLGMFRVHQGTVRTGSQLFVGDARKPFKVAHLFQLQGKEHAEIPRAIPGDICAVAKVDELHFDAVLHDSHDEDHYHLKSITFPPAMAGLAIEPERRGDEQKLSDALHKLVAEDPCVRVEHHASLNETVLYGMGDLHLRVMLERMADRYGVRCKTHAPSIPYRETITRPAEGHHRHKKQTGGAGQFGEVYLRVEPLDARPGIRVRRRSRRRRDSRRSSFPRSRRACGRCWPKARSPASRCRTCASSSTTASITRWIRRKSRSSSAGRRAFLDGFREAGPIVLEPVVRVEVTAPSSVDRRHHRRSRDAPRPRQRQRSRSPASARASARSCRWPSSPTTSRASSH